MPIRLARDPYGRMLVATVHVAGCLTSDCRSALGTSARTTHRDVMALTETATLTSAYLHPRLGPLP